MHDVHAKPHEFTFVQEVWARNFRHGAKWSFGVVQCDSPHLYSFCLSSGVCWNHHIDHLLLRQATINIQE